MSDGDQYDADYFLRGKESGKSLYENYRWMPELTIPMAQTIVDYCGIQKGERILDFGCARGYVVKALRELGYEAFGCDVSQWALDNADPEVKQYLYASYGTGYDWIIAKDVLEHVKYVKSAILELMDTAKKGIFAVVPLSKFDRGEYVIFDYEKDVTHCQRWRLETWVKMFLRRGWKVEASYRVKGVKCNYYKPGWELGNGFLTVRRIEE